jgi:predicted MFS family arabinose efflux permease
MLHNTLQVNATQMSPAHRGSSLALFACVLFVGHAIGVSCAGLLAERFGTGPVIAASGVLLLVVGSAFATARRRKG